MIVSIHILFGFPPFFYRRAEMRRWLAGAPVGKSRHIREAKDVLFLGPPGVGKTHLAQGMNALRIGTVYKPTGERIFTKSQSFRTRRMR
jgi:SpoVK/Ycf46/Vps4 family AAA+-type ATPase